MTGDLHLECPDSQRLQLLGTELQKSSKSCVRLLTNIIKDDHQMGEEGLEPPTSYLEGSCSIRLSYSPSPSILPQPSQKLKPWPQLLVFGSFRLSLSMV